jgi:hypothetical protein
MIPTHYNKNTDSSFIKAFTTFIDEQYFFALVSASKYNIKQLLKTVTTAKWIETNKTETIFLSLHMKKAL